MFLNILTIATLLSSKLLVVAQSSPEETFPPLGDFYPWDITHWWGKFDPNLPYGDACIFTFNVTGADTPGDPHIPKFEAHCDSNDHADRRAESCSDVETRARALGGRDTLD
ncbi:hypothetical protein HYALB_00013965 [Hymenoscyphus albidus]|uniref:Uncharacterized protein n=1 Tax=Hymenoscyphus albidus TaxID=595503 RepID=A0A9N9M168_9HELO|nr:hypothetical protein HYALB_00013965 [Hymenoscyphus albidus]